MIRLGPLALINLLGPEGAYWFDLCRPDARAALKKLLRWALDCNVHQLSVELLDAFLSLSGSLLCGRRWRLID